jgi:hypothetical protein
MRKTAIFQIFAKLPLWAALVLLAAPSLFLAWRLTGGEIGVGFFVVAWLIMIALGAILQPRKTIQSFRSADKPTMFLAYLAVWLFTALFVLGEVRRKEQPLWIWSACLQELQRHGVAAAAFASCLYVLLYFGPFIIPYLVISWTGAVDEPAINMFASLWCGFTFFLFLDSILSAIGAFVRRMPSDVWNGWLLVLWLVFTVLAAVAWWTARNETKERRKTA